MLGLYFLKLWLEATPEEKLIVAEQYFALPLKDAEKMVSRMSMQYQSTPRKKG
jgi:hypothetical protein